MAVKQNLKMYVVSNDTVEAEDRNSKNYISFPIELPIGIDCILLLALDVETEIYVEDNLNPVCDIASTFVQNFNFRGEYSLEIMLDKVIYRQNNETIEEEFMSSIRLMAKRTIRFYSSRTALLDKVISPVFDAIEKRKKVIAGMINSKLLNDVSEFTEASELLK